MRGATIIATCFIAATGCSEFELYIHIVPGGAAKYIEENKFLVCDTACNMNNTV